MVIHPIYFDPIMLRNAMILRTFGSVTPVRKSC